MWVDLYESAAVAHRWLAGVETEADLDAGSVNLEGELLPDWYEDWVTDERDRYRQLRVHALEAIAGRLARIRRWGDAVQAALAALVADPLRESAHRTVISVYLAEGNVAEAMRQLRRCERLMFEEVGIRPSFDLDDLMPDNWKTVKAVTGPG
jgi:DNA-binding SARP family transcriptional activator